ncbi:helix-turn-helix domain-containing protein [Nocardia amamiensis]|uniref:Helix-turn-helix transcriptional regulator n=1 Tax=Nocardia amamiensis TaxID=404578 RepID=A0ABS0CVS9_9NOCA|nr:helix-turn-helix transcriptional regulator [Nocardia amamiensis]MBF6300600.1 helix-turn-helix transcriptional regulator [Nocardia amamiensis]
MITQEEFDRRTAEQRATPEYQQAYRNAEIAYRVGKMVREAREARGWTQIELAARSGLKQHAISRLEAGDVVPTLTTLEKIAQAFGGHVHVNIAA